MNPSQPIIFIDPKVECNIILKELYYNPSGYYRSAQKLHKVAKKQGHNFELTDVCNFLYSQIIWQIHTPKPKYIPYASFNDIVILNEVHMSDTTPMPHYKVGRQIFKHRFVIKDVASRYRRSLALTDLFATHTSVGK